MTKRIYEHKCSKGHTNALLVDYDDRVTSCLICGGPSRRIISAPHILLDPISGHFPSATNRWEDNHRQVHREPDDGF